MRLSLKKKFNSFNKTVKSQISLKSLYNKVNREYIGGSMKEKYIKLMEELYKVMMKKGEPFRARAYKKAEEAISTYDGEIMNPDDLKSVKGIGPVIIKKMKEFSETGKLELLEKAKNDPEQILANIYGVGPKKAKDLVSKGITSIEKMRENEDMLNDVQKTGLKYYDDLLKRIPRDEIDEYKNIFTQIFNEINTDGNMSYEIVGSYRRNASSSGDIDIIVTSKNNNDKEKFIKFLDLLKEKNIIIEFLSKGKTKSLTITKINNKLARRVDFLFSSIEEYPFAILYFTGSKTFNTVMRNHALKMSYTLNEHGLSKMENKKKGEKVNKEFLTEKDIFDFLKLEYKEPVDRIDGRSIMPIKNTSVNIISSPDDKAESKKINKNISKEVISEEKKNENIILQEKAESKGKVEKNKTIKKKKEKLNKPIKDKTVKNKMVKKRDTTIIKEFKQKGITILETLEEKQLTSIITKSQKAYYNDTPLMTDNEYDIVREFTDKKYPDNKAVEQIGAPVKGKNKVKLPYFMGSMDKIKPSTDAITKWKDIYKGPYIISCKLDGVSGLYTTEGDKPKLYTRGNGIVGQDISHLIPYLKLPKDSNLTIRGEFIVKKQIFDEKYSSEFSNSRNFVSGIINSKTINKDKIKSMDFVSYEILKPELKPSEQFKLLNNIDIDVVKHEIREHIDNDFLSTLLVSWKKNYEYLIDGIICGDDNIYPRTDKNPEHAFAFKMILSDQIAEAKVLDVIWNPSKDGYLKPKIRIEPINISGVKIEYATAFNAKYIEENKLGIGAQVKIIRSGDVIPYIMEVTVHADTAKMPEEEYEWNDTHVDIILKNKNTNKIVLLKNIAGFYKGIGTDGLSDGNVQRLIDTGYDTIEKIYFMKEEDFLKVEGFKEKLSKKIYTSIHDKIKEASLSVIMSASNIFGHGMAGKKIDIILKAHPNILQIDLSKEEKIKLLLNVKGMAKKSAELFIEGIPEFMKFLKNMNLEDKLEIKEPLVNIDKNNPLYEKNILMTGFRDKELIDKLVNNYGVNIVSSVTSKTDIVIIKNNLETSGKVEKAKELNKTIYTVDDFKKKYNF